MEKWKDIEGYEGLYKISSHGQVKRLERTITTRNRWGEMKRTFPEKILSPPLQYGYPRVGLWKDGKSKHYVVHRLVAKAFIPNPENKPNINHIDANKENNHINNLEWCTQKENISHSWDKGLQKPGRGETHSQSKLKEKEVVQIRNTYNLGCFSLSEIGRAYNVSAGCIYKIVNNETWKHV